MNNILISVGCDRYDVLSPLNGAEKDAKRILDCLMLNGHYNNSSSILLSSPNLAEMTTALGKGFTAASASDALTIFFAGHGAVSSGNFYLCVRDTINHKFSLSAFSMVSLFTMINEFRIGQINIIVDACEAGGSSYDLGNLLKSDMIGTASSTSISFLGACAANQYAKEDDEGGRMTQMLLRHLRGEEEVQTTQPFLDLIEVGNAVSRRVREQDEEQVPICWGLTLSGQGRFAVNPLYYEPDGDPIFRVEDVAPLSEMGSVIQKFSAELWNEYRMMVDDFDPRRLLDLLARIVEESKDAPSQVVSLVEGLVKSFSLRATNSQDLLMESNVIATCAVALLPICSDNVIDENVQDLLRRKFILDQKLRINLLNTLISDPQALLQAVAPIADLYYLPIRILRILGWLASTIVIASLLGWNDDDVTTWKVIELIIEQYEGAIAAINDEQAVGLYLFLKACQLADRTEIAKTVVNGVYASFVERKGKVARVGLDRDHAFNFILSLVNPDEISKTSYKANPSNLLSTLLLSGHQLDLGADWQLRDLDGESAGYFLPESYLDFSKKVIEHGTNDVQQLGHGLWSLSSYHNFLQERLHAHMASHGATLNPTTMALCILSSLLFPDRMPLFMEVVMS